MTQTTITQEQKDIIDAMIADATLLQNAGRWTEADVILAEAENLLDRWESEGSL